jgi:hypothetical protein
MNSFDTHQRCLWIDLINQSLTLMYQYICESVCDQSLFCHPTTINTRMSKTIRISDNNVTILGTSITQGPTLGVGIRIPAGPTLSRPPAPVIGTMRYNTDLARLEVWNGFFWAVTATSTDPTAPFTLPSQTVLELSGLTATAGAMVFCTDAAGGSLPVFYDGSDWRRVTDRTIVD